MVDLAKWPRLTGLALVGALAVVGTASAQETGQDRESVDAVLRAAIREGRDAASAAENEFYKLITLPLPEDVVLEVGGLIRTVFLGT